MTHPDQNPRSDGHRYAVRVDGRLDARWTGTFDGMTITALDDGTTVLVGAIPDQAALHGLLRTVRDLGLPLVSLSRLDEATSASPEPTHPESGA